MLQFGMLYHFVIDGPSVERTTCFIMPNWGLCGGYASLKYMYVPSNTFQVYFSDLLQLFYTCRTVYTAVYTLLLSTPQSVRSLHNRAVFTFRVIFMTKEFLQQSLHITRGCREETRDYIYHKYTHGHNSFDMRPYPLYSPNNAHHFYLNGVTPI